VVDAALAETLVLFMGVVLQVSAVRIDVVVHSHCPCPQAVFPLLRRLLVT
jgi:hypothetical protein